MENQPPSEAKCPKRKTVGKRRGGVASQGDLAPLTETEIMGWGVGRVESHEVASSRQTHWLQAIQRKVLSQ